MIGEYEMIIALQIAVYCGLYFWLIRVEAKDSGMNCLYFYPKEYQNEAFARGLADKITTRKKGVAFMITFAIVLFIVLVSVIAFLNRATDYRTAYAQTALFLVAANWFDGIVIDGIWVGHSRIWDISEMHGVPYLKTWNKIIKKRSACTALCLIIAIPTAQLVVWLAAL
jgi:hypothetical protein